MATIFVHKGESLQDAIDLASGDDEPPPIYTSELPTEPGYYWFKFDGLNTAIITIYKQEDGSLIAMAAGSSIGVTLKTLAEQGGKFGPHINQPAEGISK